MTTTNSTFGPLPLSVPKKNLREYVSLVFYIPEALSFRRNESVKALNKGRLIVCTSLLKTPAL